MAGPSLRSTKSSLLATHQPWNRRPALPPSSEIQRSNSPGRAIVVSAICESDLGRARATLRDLGHAHSGDLGHAHSEARPCASPRLDTALGTTMRDHARPCATMRDHARPCASMRKQDGGHRKPSESGVCMGRAGEPAGRCVSKHHAMGRAGKPAGLCLSKHHARRVQTSRPKHHARHHVPPDCACPPITSAHHVRPSRPPITSAHHVRASRRHHAGITLSSWSSLHRADRGRDRSPRAAAAALLPLT